MNDPAPHPRPTGPAARQADPAPDPVAHRGEGCPRCAADTTPTARFCAQCGLELTVETVDPERRRITTVFVDLNGYTTLTEQLDPEDVRTITNELFAMVTSTVERWGGRIDNYAGDGAMAVFGDRLAREDDPARAVRATLEIHAGTAQLRPDVSGRGPLTLSVHSGIATGMAVTGDRNPDPGASAPLGDAVNLAARLQALAGPGEILACPLTARLCDHVADFTSIGGRAIKGKELPVEVYRVGGLRADDSARIPSPLVARDRELAELEDAVSRLVADGTGTSILVVGEAGAGKSRLFEEFRSRHTGGHGHAIRWLEGQGRGLEVSAPYAPLAQIVAAAAGLDDTAGPEAVTAGLAALLRDLDERRDLTRADDHLAVLRSLLGVDDDTPELAPDRQGFRRRLLDAVGAVIRAIAADHPTVVCVQDLHWTDISTRAVLDDLVPLLAPTTLVLGNTRPATAAATDDGPTTAHGPIAAERTILLGDLDHHDIATVLTARLGSAPATSLTELVARRSGGNVFFVEEVLEGLLEAGALAAGPDGWHLAHPEHDLRVPDTVQGVVAARIDLLSPPARATIRRASVFGPDFAVADLIAITDSSEIGGLADTVHELVRADLIRPVADHDGDTPGRPSVLGAIAAIQPADDIRRYRYKHALTHDVAHAGLTRHERRRLHLAAAHAIEARTGGHRVDLAETLARHYCEAGVVGSAVHHLQVSSRRALDRYAVDEADQHLDVAYRMICEQSPSAERVELLGPLLVRWVLVHYYRGTWRQATQLLESHAAEIDAASDPSLRGLALAWGGFAEGIAHADVPRGLDLLDEAVRIGRLVDDAEVLAHALTWRAWTRFFAGRHEEALADGREVETHLDRLDDDLYPRIKSSGAVGLALLGLGRFGEAAATAHTMLEIGASRGSSRALSMGYAILALGATMCADPDAHRLGVLGVESAADPIYRDFARIMAVQSLVAAGELDRARDEHARLVASCSELGLDGIILAVASARGVLSVLEGHLTEGMVAIEAAIERCETTGFRFVACLGRVHRAAVRARSVTGEASVSVSSIARNPRFVVEHAVPARRRARSELEGLLASLPDDGAPGFRPMTALELLKVHHHAGDHEAVAALADDLGRLVGEPAGDHDPGGALRSAVDQVLATPRPDGVVARLSRRPSLRRRG